jgi:hypothetical protein
MTSLFAMSGYEVLTYYKSISSDIFDQQKAVQTRQEQFDQNIDIEDQSSSSLVQSNGVSGNYNLAFLVSKNSKNSVETDTEQFYISKRISNDCGIHESFIGKVVQYFKRYGQPSKYFTMVDLLIGLEINNSSWALILSCFRVAPRNKLIHLKQASSKTIKNYFELSSPLANRLKDNIASGLTVNKAGVTTFLHKYVPQLEYSARLRNILITGQENHRVNFYQHDLEEFAYNEQLMDKDGIWTKSRTIFLWTPEN